MKYVFKCAVCGHAYNSWKPMRSHLERYSQGSNVDDLTWDVNEVCVLSFFPHNVINQDQHGKEAAL